jgi:hypothetical protein
MRFPKRADKLLVLSLILFSFLSLSAEEKSYPLELEVSCPPSFCGGRIYLFSKNGRNQTLAPENDAPSCNLVQMFPAVEPVCVRDKLFVADSSGAVYEMGDGYPKEVLSASGKVLREFEMENSLFVLGESRIISEDGGITELPFKAVDGFSSGNSILIFGDKEALIFSSGRVLMRFNFSKGPVRAACEAGNRIVAGTDKAVFFLDSVKGGIKKKFATKSEVTALLAYGADKIAVATKDHFIRLLDLKGNVLWQTRIEGRPLGLWPHKKGFLTAVGGGRRIILIDPAKGTQIWSFTLKQGEIIMPPRFSGGKAAVFAFDSKPEPMLYLVDTPE